MVIDVNKYKYCTNLEENDNNLQCFNLKLSNNYNKVDENWLKFEIPDIIKYGIGKTNIFKLLDDKDNQEICICQFIEKYNISGNLNRYFQYDENFNSYNKIFGDIKYIGIVVEKDHENLEKCNKFLQYSYFNEKMMKKNTLKRKNQTIKILTL